MASRNHGTHSDYPISAPSESGGDVSVPRWGTYLGCEEEPETPLPIMMEYLFPSSGAAAREVCGACIDSWGLKAAASLTAYRGGA